MHSNRSLAQTEVSPKAAVGSHTGKVPINWKTNCGAVCKSMRSCMNGRDCPETEGSESHWDRDTGTEDTAALLGDTYNDYS